MRTGLRVLLCIGTSALFGCASVVPKEPPPEVGSITRAVVATRLPTDAEKYSATSLPDSYFGASGARGSAGVGLLFGPLGVAANIAHIQSENKRRAAPLTSLTSTNLATVLTSAVPGLESGNAGNQLAYELVPSATLFFTTDTAYYVTCTINAEVPKAADKPWRARYAVNAGDAFDAKDPAGTEKALSTLRTCFRQAYQLFDDHTGGRLGAFSTKRIKVGSSDSAMTLTMPVADSALPDRVIGNDGLGLVEFRRSGVVDIQ